MAIIQSVGTGGSSPVTIAATKEGSTIIILVGTTGATPTVSDNLGTVYNKVSVPGPTAPLYCFYAKVAAGVTTITFTSFSNCTAFIIEESGLPINTFDSISVGYYNSSGSTTWVTNPVNVATSSGVGYVFTQYTGGAGMTGFGVNSPWSLLTGTGITNGVVTNSSYGSQAGVGRRTITASGTYSASGITAGAWYPDAYVIFFKSSPLMRISSNLSLTSTTGGETIASSDDFNRSSTTASNLGGNWGTYSGLGQGAQILSNRASAVSNFTCRNYYNVTLANDQYAQATIANTNYGGVGLALRSSSSAASGYYVDFWEQPAGGIEIYYRQDSSTTTSIANTAHDAANTVSLGDIIKATVVGNTITAYVNGIPRLNVIHNTLTSGLAGIFLDASGGKVASDASLDNFVAGNVTPTSSTTVNYGAAVQITNIVEYAPTTPPSIGANTSKGQQGITSITTDAVTTTSGSTLLAYTYTSSFSSITDNKGNTWTPTGTFGPDPISGKYCVIWENVGGTRGSGHTVTFNYSSSGARTAYVIEILGTTGSDISTWSYDASSPYTSTTSALAQSDELALLFGGAYGYYPTGTASFVESSGFTTLLQQTDPQNYEGSFVAYKLPTGVSGLSTSWTVSGISPSYTSTMTTILTYKGVGSGLSPKLYANGTFVCTQFIEA